VATRESLETMKVEYDQEVDVLIKNPKSLEYAVT
jgi:hypothetical protein